LCLLSRANSCRVATLISTYNRSDYQSWLVRNSHIIITSVIYSQWLPRLWLSRLQPCDPTQPWPYLQSTNSPLTEFATPQGRGQSGSAALPASVFVMIIACHMLLRSRAGNQKVTWAGELDFSVERRNTSNRKQWCGVEQCESLVSTSQRSLRYFIAVYNPYKVSVLAR
jgi:hypothetical protein